MVVLPPVAPFWLDPVREAPPAPMVMVSVPDMADSLTHREL